MKYIKSKKGYFYRINNSGKKTRISELEYSKNSKRKINQKGGGINNINISSKYITYPNNIGIVSFASNEKTVNSNNKNYQNLFNRNNWDITMSESYINEKLWILLLHLGSYDTSYYKKLSNSFRSTTNEKYIYLDCVDNLYLRNTLISPRDTGHCVDDPIQQRIPCCKFQGYNEWFQMYTANSLNVRYLIIFLTHGWLDSPWTFIELLLFKFLVEYYDDKKIILFICEKIPNEIVEKIVNFLNVEVEILFMSNEHNMNYNYLLSLMNNKSNSNHIPISLKFLNKIIKNLLTFREIINDNFKINNLINKNLLTFRIFFYKTNDNDLIEILKKKFNNLMELTFIKN